MEISVRKAEKWNKIDPEVLDIYIKSFPEDERRPLESFKELIGNEFFGFNIVEAEGHPIGLVTTWDFPEALYIEHLAMAPSMRGHGAGSKLLKMLSRESEKPLLVEVEPPETSAEAASRIGFYNRNGFTEISGVDYIQPPYSPGLNPLRLLLLSTGEIPDINGFINDRLYREVYRVSQAPRREPS